MPQASYQLTKKESQDLTRCETAIRRFVKSGFEACKALKTIKEKGYYLKTHKSFEEYCDEVWAMKKPTANRMIRSAVAYEVLENAGVKQLPMSESVLRPIVPLDDEKKVAVWQQVIKASNGTKITASIVDGVIKKKNNKTSRTPTAKSVVDLISKLDLTDADKTMIMAALK